MPEEDNSSYQEEQQDNNDRNYEGNGPDDVDDIAGKVFIGGLSWSTTEQTLRYYFEKYGELSDVALMVDKRTGKPRGFGFIKMKDPAAVDVIMSNDHTIDGRLVDVKRALPRDKAPGPARSEACKIFVGGLSIEVTEKEFGDYFNKFGPVKDAVVMVDRNTGSSRGFGFITFEKEETVEKVLKGDHEIKGKYVEIKRAEPREASRGSYNDDYSHGGYGGHSGGRGGGRGGRGGRGGGRDNDNNPPSPYGNYMNMGRGYPAPYGAYRAPYPMPYAYPPMGPGGYPMYPPMPGYPGYPPQGAPNSPPPAGYGASPYAPRDGSQSGENTPKGQSGQAGGFENPPPYNPSMPPRPAYGYGGAVPMPAYGYGYSQPMPAAQPPAGGKPPGGNEEGASAGGGGYGAYRGGGSGAQRSERGYRPY